jgi:putative transposase
MREIIALPHCLAAYLSATSLRQLRHIVAAMLPMTGRMTTLGLSRWTEKGGSVRTLQRWMQTRIDWGAVLWAVVRVHLLDDESPTPRYGDKLNYDALPAAALVHTVTEGTLVTDTYQLTALHKDFPDPLNLVVLVKTQTRTGKRAHALLFSTDLALSPAQLTDYYSLRFQNEFNFRDAKQFWGLEDFMNTSQPAVTNAAHLAFLMVNVSAVLLQPHRLHQPDFSVLDLKAYYRARRYLDETIKSLPVSPDVDLFSRLWQRFSRLGGIRARHSQHLAA